jgi:hypothetical protein
MDTFPELPCKWACIIESGRVAHELERVTLRAGCQALPSA